MSSPRTWSSTTAVIRHLRGLIGRNRVWHRASTASTAAMFVYVNHTILFSELWVYEGRRRTWWNVNWKIYTYSHAHHSYYSSEALTCFRLRCFSWASCAFIQSVLWATNWIIDLPRFLFLDLNDIPGNFSNCHDLICASSFACRDVDGGSGGTAAFQRGGTLRSTFIQTRLEQLLFPGFFFSLSPPPLPLVRSPLN